MRATRSQDRRPSAAVLAGAVLVSSFLFGLAHPFSPLLAMLLGPTLAVAYLRGGWESAVLAHFIANWIVFAVYF
jgi:membrane protease YdiL (CAAX protease family)